MPGPSAEWWLELPDGTRRRVGSAGLLIGRSPDCDLVLHDHHASRRHAIVHLTADGAALVSLGRDAEREGSAELSDGMRLSFPGLEVTVRVSKSAGESEPSWVLRHHGGGIFGVSERGLSVGNGPEDDLHIAGCAAADVKKYAVTAAAEERRACGHTKLGRRAAKRPPYVGLKAVYLLLQL